MLQRHYRVGVDGFNLALPNGTGVATYARSLIAAVQANGRPVDLVYGLNVAADASPALRESLFYGALAEGRCGNEPPDRISRWSRIRRRYISSAPRDLIEVPSAGRIVRQGFAARVPDCDRLFTINRLFDLGGRYLRRHGRLMPVRMPDPPAIMHWTYPVPVTLIGARNVYTVHDLVPLRLPWLSLEDRSYHELLLGRCIAEGAQILTVSETSRADILSQLPAPAEKVANIYQGVAEVPAYAPDELAGSLAALFDLTMDGYLLYYGAIEPKKNVGRLIEAYLRSGVETPLVIAGQDAWGAGAELMLLNGGHGAVPQAARRIRRIGHLKPDHLAILRAGARAFLFPSLYEGFGLPVVEAMQAGVPVLIGAAGALVEIAGGAALQADPYDVAALGRAIATLDSDADLRRHLAAAGRRRAADFAMLPYQARIDGLHGQLIRQPLPERRASRGFFTLRSGETL